VKLQTGKLDRNGPSLALGCAMIPSRRIVFARLAGSSKFQYPTSPSFMAGESQVMVA